MGGKAAGTLLLLRELSEGSSGLTQGYGCYAYFDHLTREFCSSSCGEWKPKH